MDQDRSWSDPFQSPGMFYPNSVYKEDELDMNDISDIGDITDMCKLISVCVYLLPFRGEMS